MDIQPTDSEMEEIVDNLKNNVDDVEFFMQKAYEDALFLGTTIQNDNEAYEIIVFMIRLCMHYFKRFEDYEKLSELKKLTDLIHSEKKKIVTEKVIDDIAIFSN